MGVSRDLVHIFFYMMNVQKVADILSPFNSFFSITQSCCGVIFEVNHRPFMAQNGEAAGVVLRSSFEIAAGPDDCPQFVWGSFHAWKASIDGCFPCSRISQ